MRTKSSLAAVFSTLILCLLTAGTASATSYTLTLTNRGLGTIYRNPTNTSYPAGVTVTLSGVPDPGWYFSSWTGDTNSSLNPLNVMMNSNMNVTGNFVAYPVYALALATNGQGGIVLSPSGGSDYSNTLVTATATAANGWVFAGWSGATNSSANPVSFALNTNGTLTGTFAELPAFDMQPVSVTNKAGSTVSFTAHAVGTGPVNYQWYFGTGTASNGNSNALSLTNVGTGQAGSYWAVATNNYGSATSQVATLTLTNASGPTNVVSAPNQASLLAAIAVGGWVGIEFNGTLTLTNTINITNNVVLDGTAYTALVSGGDTVQLFNVATNASLTISNLTLANGNSSYGAAIDNNGGMVALINCTLTNNQAFRGGAIYNNGGTVTLLGSAFPYNTATGNGCSGGAAYQASGSMVATNCVFSFNSAINTGNGISSAVGGALAFNGGTVTIDYSQFIKNSASGIGPAWVNSGSSAAGGAIYSSATLNVDYTSFIGNEAIADNRVVLRSLGPGIGDGGAIDNEGTATFNHCLFYSNSAQGGNVLPYSSGSVLGAPGYGGGIYNDGQFFATNNTLALNSAVGGGAGEFGSSSGVSGTALGGGIFNTVSGTFAAMNLTIASNICSSPAGAYSINGMAAGAQIANTNGMLSVHNTLIAYGGTNSNAYGPVTDDGYNICSDGSASLFNGSSYNYTDPQLGSLGSYGGPTLTMALLPTSPAIDNGDINGCPTTDQRGFFRPFGSGPDMGAFEFGSAATTNLVVNISVTSSNAALSFSAFTAGTYYLQYSTNLINWINLSTNGPFAVPAYVSQTVGRQGLNRCFFRVLQP